MKKIIFIIFLTYLFLILMPITGMAGGLSSTFGEVLVTDLEIGKEYSLRKHANLPLKIVNTFAQEVNLKVEVLLPQKSELKAGYVPLPDISWIRLEKELLKIGKEAEGETDIHISIPNDQKYKGKKFQVFIWSHTVGQAIGVGLKSKLLLHIKE